VVYVFVALEIGSRRLIHFNATVRLASTSGPFRQFILAHPK
jgi:hypothetical protein